MRNLLDETIHILARYNKIPEDVIWVMDAVYFTTWEDFAQCAKNYNYDEGYGKPEVNENLVVVGIDWWLERHEYDGSEWWEFKTRPKISMHTLTSSIDLRSEWDRDSDNNDTF